ncbi:MAG TPA: hypothetical protein ENK86_02155 [Campylobacterales bacterium]|nr:hypothetical protein [Campylobacterales bacterium]
MRKLLLLLSLLMSSLSAGDERYAFVYSKNVDDRFINFYDKVVVEADAIDNIYALRYPDKMVAYVSVGEIEPWRKTKTPYDPSWVITENKTWHSLIADLRKDAYQAFIFERVAKLYKQGYRNFFLDTMDAYHVTAEDKKRFQKQQKALVKFIKTLRTKYPKSTIIVNRGFEILDQIYQEVDAVVAESLIARYNHAQKEYVPVPPADREWLLSNFQKAQKLGLDTISIEYSDQSTQKRLEIAKEIKKLGILPYVTDGLLQEQGECHIERIRRDVLILFNQSIFKDNNPAYSGPHLLLSMPLEYYGYVPILYDISSNPLPNRVEDKYHAVIVWSSGVTNNDESLYALTEKLKTRNVKILFLDSFHFNLTPKRLQMLGLSYEKNTNGFLDKSSATYHPPYKAYEIPASLEHEEQLIHPKDAKAVLSLTYPNGQTSTPIAVTSWGGYALDSAFLQNIGEKDLWTIDPFILFKEALGLESIPVPDPTTEAGRRILLAHVDGDGFMEPVRFEPESLATEYLLEHIYKKYPFPHTLSVIQGEVDSIGLYPELSPRMKQVSQELYRLPWVEPASHTLSHPFFWAEAKHAHDAIAIKHRADRSHNHKGEGKLYHLPLKNYVFSLVRETKESVDFALSLAPKEKQSTKVLFWSGDCLPTRKTLAYVERQGILAMNGGDTTISKKNPWLSHIAPFGLQHDEYWQIYTGQQNENVYTNDWLGPFWGYRDAVDTFVMTEEPRRLKPINIYYHFYSGSKLASFHALKRIYDWAIQQKTSKLYASQYIQTAADFYRTAIAKIDGEYEVRNLGYLKTFRLEGTAHANIRASRGVAGYQHHNHQTYLTLDSRRERRIVLDTQPPSSPYLIESNGWVRSITQKGTHYRFTLDANVALEATFHLPKGCQQISEIEGTVQHNGTQWHLQTEQNKGVRLVFDCRK